MIRFDLSVDWDVSPRIITIAAPSIEITIQDLHDTCRYLEFNKMSEPILIDSAGKEDLGGNVAVGLTATLQDAQVAFEARSGPEWVLVKISGGNLVALNDAGDNIDPRYPTAFITADRASSSSATTQGITEIQNLSFDKEIWHDHDKGYTFAEALLAGIDAELLGNTQYPASDHIEVMAIAESKKINKLKYTGYHDLIEAIDMTGYHIYGDSPVTDIINIGDAPVMFNNTFEKLRLSGILDGGCTLRQCSVKGGLSYFSGSLYDCGIDTEPIVLYGGSVANIIDCRSVVPGAGDRPTIDFNDTTASLDIRNWHGGIELINKTTSDGDVSIDMSSGIIYIRSSCTAGKITVRGLARIIDESGSGCEVEYTGLLDPDYVQSMTYNGMVYVDSVNGGTGTNFPMGNIHNPVNNVEDAMAIAAARELDTFHVHGSITVSGIADGLIQQMTIIGARRDMTVITFDNILAQGLKFETCTIAGTFKAGSVIGGDHCRFLSVSGARIVGESCVLDGVTTLGAGESNFYSCFDGIPGVEVAEINVGPCTSLGIWDYQGGLRITNMTTIDTVVSAMITAGRLFVDATNTEGNIIVKGMANLVGTTGGTTIDSDGLITKDAMQDYIWGYLIEAGVSAEEIMRIKAAALAGKASGAGTGTMTFKGLDGSTDRIISTVDGTGNRTAVNVNGS